MYITLTVVYRLRHKLTSTKCNFSKKTQYFCICSYSQGLSATNL